MVRSPMKSRKDNFFREVNYVKMPVLTNIKTK